MQKKKSFEVVSNLLKDGKLEEAEKLLDASPIDFSFQDKNGKTLLHLAVECQAVAIVKKATEVMTADTLGDTPLHLAARQGHLEMCLHLLSQGADAYQKNYQEETPLAILFKDHLDLLPSVLKLIPISYGFLSLYFALSEEAQTQVGSLDEILLQADSMTKAEAGIYLMQEKRLPLLRSLLDQGIISSEDRRRDLRSLAHAAVQFKQLSILERIPKEHLDFQDQYGLTPLHYACKEGDAELISYLLSQEVNYNCVSFYESTPVMLAAIANPKLPLLFLNHLRPNEPLHFGEPLDYRLFGNAYDQLTDEEQEKLETIFSVKHVRQGVVLAHAWGLSGTLYQRSLVADYEGCSQQIMSSFVIPIFKQFLEKASIPTLYQGLREECDSLFKTRDLTPQEAATQIKLGSRVLIPVETDDHLSYLLFNQKNLYYCDRSTEKPGVMSYRLPEEAPLQETLEKIEKLQETPEMETYILEELPQELDLTPFGYLALKHQNVGNCTMASFKTVIQALFLSEAYRQGVKGKQAVEIARKTYKQFTAFLRTGLLKNYLGNHPDPTLIEKIQAKLRATETNLKKIFPDEEYRLDLAEVIGAMSHYWSLKHDASH